MDKPVPATTLPLVEVTVTFVTPVNEELSPTDMAPAVVVNDRLVAFKEA
jgi:hypothetical protein